MDSHSEEIEINLVELFFVLKKKIAIIILAALAAGIIVGVYCSYFVTPMYGSTSKLYILTKTTSVTSLADIQLGSSLTLDYMELIYSRPVVEQVIKNQNLKETYESLSAKIKVDNPVNTRILTLNVICDEPNTAKIIADEFAKVSKVQISKIMDTKEPNIVEQGHVTTQKVSPSIKRNVLIATVLGGLLAIGIIIVLHLLNDTIRSSDDVEKYLGINVLTTIPLAKSEAEKSKVKKRRMKKSAKKNEEKKEV